MAVAGSCCWVGSVCSLGKTKPPGACDGWIKGRALERKGVVSVLNRTVKALKDEIAQHNLQCPGGVLADAAELGALAEGLIGVFLPTAVGMESREKCCDKCFGAGMAKMKDPRCRPRPTLPRIASATHCRRRPCAFGRPLARRFFG